MASIRAHQPDLVFLDVQMPELDGFDVITEVGTDKMPPVIFVTAFDDYAVSAFEFGAFDYLLKPVDHVRFHQTLDRAKKRLKDSPQSDRLVAAERAAQVRRPARRPEEPNRRQGERQRFSSSTRTRSSGSRRGTIWREFISPRSRTMCASR